MAVCGVVGCVSAAAPRERPQVDLRAPVVYGGDNGLEVRSWIVALSPAEIGTILEERLAGTPPALSQAVEERWGGEGLRMVRIPLGEFGTLSEALSRPTTRNTHWLGRTGNWTEIARGIAWKTPRPVLVRGEWVALPRGDVRLLARAWTTPTLERPRMQVELALQHFERGRAGRIEDVFSAAEIRAVETEGLLFRDLSLQAGLETGYVYLIAPAPVEHASASHRMVGPPVEPPARLGHALLCAEGEAEALREKNHSTLIALIPRVPERLRLLAIFERAGEG